MRLAVGVLALVLALCAFLFSAWVTTTDPQGVFIFFFSLPVCLGLCGAALALAGGGRVWLRRSALGGLVFLVVFVVSAFLPGLNHFPVAVVGGVAWTYEALTGKTPYQAVRDRRGGDGGPAAR